MKNIKIMLLFVLIWGCKKDYTCSCTTTDLSTDDKIAFEAYYNEVSKKDASQTCSSLEAGGNVPGVSSRTCTLK